MRSVVTGLALVASSIAHAAPLAVSIVATPNQTRVHRGEQFEVRLEVANPTTKPIAFEAMSCDWIAGWRTSDAQLILPGVECTRNAKVTIVLKPGEVERRALAVVVGTGAALGAHSVRFGLTPIGSTDTTWSSATTVTVIDAAKDVAIASAPLEPRGFVFALTNTTPAPTAIADQLFVQRREADGTWSDFTSLSASHCKARPPTACTTLAARETINSYEWAATACGECESCLSTPFVEAGTYRLVAQSCDGKHETVGGVLVLPPE
jgi:hypothetical protein